MQKIIIDTNVLVSAIIQRSFPYYILSNVLANRKILICISEDLFKEYYEVLNRKKFSKYPDFIANAHLILAEINRIGTKYKPNSPVKIINDKDDNKLLELSRKSKADFLITGNHNDFTMSEFEGTKIVNPKDYWNNHIIL
jgi:putative PIN family toxin of toxin-antitoxin system